jgi:tetratricopeptide (TPR) repeat protein
LKDFLNDHLGPEDSELLRALIEEDIAQRRRRGATPLPEDYHDVLDTPAAPWLDEVFPDPSRTVGPNAVVQSSPFVPPPDDDFPSVPGYEILGELGRGGMGVVYKARQVRLGRLVALKMILNVRHAGPDERERFTLEAEAVARLQHPNIVQIHEIGEHGGVPFFSLEFCAGGSLADKLRGATLPDREAAQLLETLARAMHSAHQANVIHRDLKPANVLLTGTGIPRIADFGLAKRMDAAGLTQTGAIVGTPNYMPPEQAHSATEQIGPVSDVYSLSAILYEVLTGRPPFKAATAYETIRQVCLNDPVPPRQLQPKIPLDLETICLKGLEKDPARRYGSAEELAEDLRRFLNHEPIRARPVPAWERTLKWARRNKWLTAAFVAGGAALVLLFAVAVVTAFYFRADAGRSRAEAASAQAEADREKIKSDRLQVRYYAEQNFETGWKQGTDAEALGYIAESDRKWEEAAKQFRTAFSSYTKAITALETDIRDDPRLPQLREKAEAVRARLDITTAAEQLRKDYYTVAYHGLTVTGRPSLDKRMRIIGIARGALARLKLDVSAPPEEAVKTLEAFRKRCPPELFKQVLPDCYDVLLTWAEAEAPPTIGPQKADHVAAARRALGLLAVADALGKAHGQPPSPIFHLRRARYLAQAGDPNAARKEEALACQTPETTPLDYLLTALHAYAEGQVGAASEACDNVLRLQPKHFWAHYLQGLCRLKTRQPAEAKASLLACLSIRDDIPWLHLSLASAHQELGEFQDSETRLEAARKLLDNDRLDQYTFLINRSLLRIRLKRWVEAQADLKEARGLLPDAYQAYANLAELHIQREEWKEAAAALDQAIARQPELPSLYHNRARVHEKAGNAKAARLDLEKVIALEPRNSRSETLASAYVELGYQKHRAKEYAAALADFETALRIAPDYLPALRQKADTHIALKSEEHDIEARKVLERYLSVTRDRITEHKFEVYKALGVVLARLRENSAALDAYTQALGLREETATRNLRGWVHLSVGALEPALEDFKVVLAKEPKHVDALCGLAHVLVREGKVKEAVAEADLAVRGPPSARLYLRAAGVYARAAVANAGQASAPPNRNNERAVKLLADAQGNYERAVKLLADALGLVPAEEQGAFWKQNVSKDPAFVPLLKTGKLLQLKQYYDR